MMFLEGNFFYQEYEESEGVNRVKPRDFGRFKTPSSLSELETLSNTTPEPSDRDIYGEMLYLFQTARKSRAFTTDEDVRVFCQSWLDGTEHHLRMYRDGLAVEEEERIAENLKMLGDAIHEIKVDAIAKLLFKPR